MRSLTWVPLLAAACGGSTVVLVTVEGRPTLTGVTRLHVEVESDDDLAGADFTLPEPDSLPQTFTVSANGRSGMLSITVTAFDEGGRARGEGTLLAPLDPDDLTRATVTVEPNDFVVNQMIATGQTLSVSFGHTGRQLAVRPERAFVAVWENFCPLSRCDILGRRFDERAQPITNGTTLNPDDFIVNQTSEFTTTPSIAAGAIGYLVSWRGMTDVRAAPLGLDGEHDQVTDQTVSASDSTEQAPFVMARQGGYLIAWTQTRMGLADHEVRARLYDEMGQPVAGEFGASQVMMGNQELAHGAGLPSGRFVITWLQTTGAQIDVHGRVFSAGGGVVSAADLPLTASGSNGVFGATVAATADGFALVWLDGTPPRVYLSLFHEDGTPSSTPIPVSETSGDENTTAVVAVRSDGVIGVAWHACDASAGNMDCDIRFRLAHPDGLPSGPEQVVNTTREGSQDGPSIAAFGDDAFLLAWTDSSREPPDTDGDAVRARVVYPTLERADGSLGSFCQDETDCDPGLACAAGAERSRCLPECAAGLEGQPCPEGGVCSGGVCAF